MSLRDRRAYYFDGERLGVDDFRAERDYLDGLRMRANAALHGAGIARGLLVDASDDAKSVVISAGMALQPSGREICLADDVRLGIAAIGDRSADLFIISRSRPADPSRASLCFGFKRLMHVATPFFAEGGATIDEEAVYLATVTLGADGKIAAIDMAARRFCGYRPASLGIRAEHDGEVAARLALVGDQADPFLSMRARTIRMTGALEVADGLRIGSRPARAMLDVQGKGSALVSMTGDDGRSVLAIDRSDGSRFGEAAGNGRLTVDGDIALDAGHFIVIDGAGAIECGSPAHSISFDPATGSTPARLSFNEVGRIDLCSGTSASSPTPTLSLRADGNVGLGVEDPKAALVVDGSIQTLVGVDFGDGAQQKKAAVATSIMVGAIIEWWNGGTPARLELPPEFRPCDGSLIDDPDSPLRGQHTPDLIGRTIKGATVDADIGATGGSAMHQHDLGQAPQHSHPIPHDHPTATRQTAGDSGVGVGSISRHFNAIGHAHAIDVTLGPCDPSESDGNEPNALTFTDPASTWPAAVGLMMIMRIK